MKRLEDSLFCDFSSRKDLVRRIITTYVNQEAELIKTMNNINSNNNGSSNNGEIADVSCSNSTTGVDETFETQFESAFESAFDYAESKTTEANPAERNTTIHTSSKLYKGLQIN